VINILFAALGGALGSIARYLVSGWVQAASKDMHFPYGTLAVNLIGCFVIGFLAQLAETHHVFSAEVRVLIFIGMLGGFTTFSSFSNDTFNLIELNLNSALLNIGANVVFGILLVWLGRTIATLVWK